MIMTKIPNTYNVAQLRALLTTIVDHKLKICVRFRMVGEMWQPSFMRVLKLTEEGVLLNDETKNKLITIRDLKQVMQFELDSQFQYYQPHSHYEVSPYS